MKAKTGKRPSSLSAITLRLGALVLAFWLGAMALLTWGTAQYEYEKICSKGLELGENVGMFSELDRFSLLLLCCKDCIGAVSVIPLKEDSNE